MVEFQGKFDENVPKNLNKRWLKKFWWLFVAFPAFCIFMGVLGLFAHEDEADLGLAIYLITAGVLFAPIVFLVTKIIQKVLNKSMYILSKDTTETYQFFPDGVVMTQRKGEEYEAVTRTRYSYFYRVEETSKQYFLFISRNQVHAHVVNKADLTQGTIEELNAILSQNLGTRFKALK